MMPRGVGEMATGHYHIYISKGYGIHGECTNQDGTLYRFYKECGLLIVQLFNGLHFVIRPTQGNSRRLLRRQVTFKTHRQTCCDRIRPRLTTPCHL